VTNSHVVGHCVSQIQGELPSQPPIALRVVNLDQVNDLALLQAFITFSSSATIPGRAIRPGDAIIAIGYPYAGVLSSEFKVTTGDISALGGYEDDSRYFQISAPIQPGNSGGPLLDTEGDVVGVISEKLDAIKMMKATESIPENINFAIKTGVLRDFLRQERSQLSNA
jgi:S1-C subfamily serine protease